MTESETPKKARFITPPNKLKKKVGTGNIDPALLDKAQAFIRDNPVAFEPYAMEEIKKIETILKEIKTTIKTETFDGKKVIERITSPVMILKANGGMFRYMMVSEIANILLQFLENLNDFNDDTFKIVDANTKTLKALILNKISGSGGQEGYELSKELYGVCERYYNKYNIEV